MVPFFFYGEMFRKYIRRLCRRMAVEHSEYTLPKRLVYPAYRYRMHSFYVTHFRVTPGLDDP